VTRTDRRVFCDRPKDAHMLAKIQVDVSGAVRVEISEVVQTPAGVSIWRTVRSVDDVGDAVSLVLIAGCACGDRYSVDLAPLVRGEATPCVRIPAVTVAGVSSDRHRTT
jgi:hypothetical protein